MALIAKGDDCLKVAKAIAERAKSLAPVVEGNYRDGIIVQRTPHGARVFASDQKSSWVEFGIPSQNQPAQFVLRRAAFDGAAGPGRKLVEYTSKRGVVSHITQAQADNYNRNKVT